MKAIILAAGEGTRLKPFTDNNPKCLIPLEGKSLFDHQVDTMKSCGIDDVIAVKGYMADKIGREDVRYYTNEKYATTNMVMTLWCANDELEDEVVFSYGDIIYNKEVLKKLIESDEDISVVVDMDWEKYWKLRFDDPLKDAEAFKMDREGKIQIIGQKANEISDVQAGYIGLMKFKGKGLDILKKSFLNARDVAANQGNPWGANKYFEKVYMTDMLQGIINEGNDIFAVKISGGWLEIDSNEDYELAKRLFKNGEVISV